MIITSPRAPIRGMTLVSFLMRATRSLGIGELKYTYALKKNREITEVRRQEPEESVKLNKVLYTKFYIEQDPVHTSCIKVLFLTYRTRT